MSVRTARGRAVLATVVIALAGGVAGAGCGERDDGGAVRTDGGDIVPTSSNGETTTTEVQTGSGTPTTTSTLPSEQPDGTTTIPDGAEEPEGSDK